MKLVCISDTHQREQFNNIDVPDGDVLIHCGDFHGSGDWSINLYYFIEWVKELPHKHKILVPGNHDWIFEKEYDRAMKIVDGSMEVLLDSGIEIDGVKFYGTPSQPIFFNWAFNHSSMKRKQHYDMIPQDTDVLITHTPLYGYCDEVDRGHVGCELLLNRVLQVSPKLHIFGHIHEGYGIMENENTKFINCSICDGGYSPSNKPIVLEL